MQRKKISKFPIKIRKARFSDIDSVYNIECEQFLHPWKKKLFYSEISNSISSFYLSTLPDSNEAVGFIIFWLIGNNLEIHKIAVKEKFKRNGIGTSMIKFAQNIGNNQGIKEIYLEVRESNKTAGHFYNHLGFKKLEKRKDYYQHPLEDAVIYSKSL